MNAMASIDQGTPFDPLLLRTAYGCFPSGVTAVCALIDGEPVGMAASSFVSVSLDPPLVLVCIQNSSATWKKLQAATRIGVSVLSEEQDRACSQLATKSCNRFESLAWFATERGAVFLEGAAMLLDCTPVEVIAAGDHQLVLLKVQDLQFQPTINPLVFHGSRFRKLAV